MVWRNDVRKPDDRKVGCLEKSKMKKMNSYIRKKNDNDGCLREERRRRKKMRIFTLHPKKQNKRDVKIQINKREKKENARNEKRECKISSKRKKKD